MSTKKVVAKKQPKVEVGQGKRSYLSQSDVPSYSLEEALAIPKALFENYGGKPATPLQVAKALNVQPSSGPFRMLCGASIAYGLTSGGYNAVEISAESLAVKIFKPKVEGEEIKAKVDCFFKPRVIKDFFTKYDGSAIPREDIAKNILEDMGVPSERAASVLELIIKQGELLGLITELKGKKYVQLHPVHMSPSTDEQIHIEEPVLSELTVDAFKGLTKIESVDKKHDISSIVTSQKPDERLKRVFITHGKNTKFIDPIKKLLSFGELQSVVSVEKTTISQPVPDKVMNDMRSCGAAIIHVEDELKLIDEKAEEHLIINPNVLIEIGAAMALFGRRFILLVKDGIKLPSNLQGLFEVRYNGDQLDGAATIKLLEAINDIKNQSLPSA